VRTRHLRLVSSTPSDTTIVKSNVLSPYGPVRAGLTTTQTTQDQRLSELLNSLENVVENLNYKSFTAYDTLVTAIEAVRVALLPTQIDEAGTDV
jgi:glutathionyl-hydroquinone reductase